MADRVYLIKDTEITAAMRTKANVVVGNCLTVLSANVEDFETLLPEDQTTYMSCDVSGINYVSGLQTKIWLPERIINN